MNRKKPFHSPSFCWLADVQAPGLYPSDRLCTQPILSPGLGDGKEGKEGLVFIIPLREETLELLPVSWSGLPLRMP